MRLRGPFSRPLPSGPAHEIGIDSRPGVGHLVGATGLAMSGTEESSPCDATEVDPGADRDDTGLDDLPDGIGCAEIWEHLSERRRGD